MERPGPKKYSLLLIDEQEIFCLGVKVILAETEFAVTNDFRDGENISKTASFLNPDIILLGQFQYRKEVSLEMVRTLRRELPHLPVVVALPTENPADMQEAVTAGAANYFLKSAPAFQLPQILRDTLESGNEETRKLEARIARFSQSHPPRAGEELTWREKSVLYFVSLGYSNKEIAGELTISVETVKEHLQNITRKLRVNNRTQAAVMAVKMGITER